MSVYINGVEAISSIVQTALDLKASLSLLTTQGDTIYATGASVWARLPKGTGLQVYRMNAGATAPEWAASAATSISSGTYTGDGTQNRAIPHGLSATPKMVIINRTAGNNLSVITTNNTLAVTPTVSTNASTALDSTNFYVGLNASGAQTNVDTVPYTWEAFL